MQGLGHEGVTTGELVRRMVMAHAKGDDSAFVAAVRDMIAEEKRKKHVVLARELERILAGSDRGLGSANDVLALFGARSSELPRDKDRETDLIDLIEPRRSLEDLVLAREASEQIGRVVEENKRAELLHSRGLRPARRVLFCGPPGCGKTVTAEAIASALFLPLALVRFDAVISSYLGETAANLRRVFDFARGRPMVLLFDEFDAIGKKRDDEQEHGELKRVVNSFLQMLDRFKGETLAIAATNHEQLLDSAIWRRFDQVIFLALPSTGEIEQLLQRYWHQVAVPSSLRLDELARDLHGLAHADVERLSIDAMKQMVLRDRRTLDSEIVESLARRELERRKLSGVGSATDIHVKTPVDRKTSRRRK